MALLPQLHKVCAVGLVLMALRVSFITVFIGSFSKWRLLWVPILRILRSEITAWGYSLEMHDWHGYPRLARHVLSSSIMAVIQCYFSPLPISLQFPLHLLSIFRVAYVLLNPLRNTCLIPDVAAVLPVSMPTVERLRAFVSPLLLLSSTEASGPELHASIRVTYCHVLAFVYSWVIVVPVVMCYLSERRQKHAYILALHGAAVRPLHSNSSEWFTKCALSMHLFVLIFSLTMKMLDSCKEVHDCRVADGWWR